MSELSPQQKRFCQEYLVDYSPSRAAIRAGYSIKNASSQASELMKKPGVQTLIAEMQKAHGDKIGIDKERVLQELAKIAFSNIKDYLLQDDEGNTYVDIKGLSRDTASALSEVTVETTQGLKVSNKKIKVKVADKIAALLSIGKHLGMFKEQIEHTGKLTLEQLVEHSLEEIAVPSVEPKSEPDKTIN